MIMLTAAVVRTWHLSNNGFGRPYYAAGVRSMLRCPHCFRFNSFDPAGFVSLDKPPIAIWFQALSAKLLGFRGIVVLLPQVIANRFTARVRPDPPTQVAGQDASTDVAPPAGARRQRAHL
jgi:4-amino-4-deoxy-L-arabinose transferase-like glycosyltransferase